MSWKEFHWRRRLEELDWCEMCGEKINSWVWLEMMLMMMRSLVRSSVRPCEVKWNAISYILSHWGIKFICVCIKWSYAASFALPCLLYSSDICDFRTAWCSRWLDLTRKLNRFEKICFFMMCKFSRVNFAYLRFIFLSSISRRASKTKTLIFDFLFLFPIFPSRARLYVSREFDEK